MINILIVNWNNGEECLHAIECILNSNYLNIRIFIIDNNSNLKDLFYLNQCKQISNQFNIDLHLIFNKENFGYTGANNIGFNFITSNNFNGDILILNPDIQIQNNTLEEMHNALNHQNVGGVMIRTYASSGTHLYDSIYLNGMNQIWFKTQQNNIVETDYLAGSCLLLNRKLFDKIYLFDDNYFLYWEEVDLSLRIKSAGYKIVSTTYSFVIRNDNETKRKIISFYYLTRNSFIICKKFKNFKIFDLTKYLFKIFLISLKFSIINRNIYYLSNYFKGLISGLKIIFHIKF
jgi:GT2 family glycosyltransferase